MILANRKFYVKEQDSYTYFDTFKHALEKFKQGNGDIRYIGIECERRGAETIKIDYGIYSKNEAHFAFDFLPYFDSPRIKKDISMLSNFLSIDLETEIGNYIFESKEHLKEILQIMVPNIKYRTDGSKSHEAIFFTNDSMIIRKINSLIGNTSMKKSFYHLPDFLEFENCFYTNYALFTSTGKFPFTCTSCGNRFILLDTIKLTK